jgi:hypothetical protein
VTVKSHPSTALSEKLGEGEPPHWRWEVGALQGAHPSDQKAKRSKERGKGRQMQSFQRDERPGTDFTRERQAQLCVLE